MPAKKAVNKPAIEHQEKGPNKIVSVVRMRTDQTLCLILAVQDNAAIASMAFDDFGTPGTDAEDNYQPSQFIGEQGRIERVLRVDAGSMYGLVAAIASPPGKSQLMLKLTVDDREVYRRYGNFPDGESPNRLIMAVNVLASAGDA